MTRPDVDYISTDFDVDSSSHFLFRARTVRQTYKLIDATESSTHVTAIATGMVN